MTGLPEESRRMSRQAMRVVVSHPSKQGNMYHVPMASHHDPQIHIHAQAASPTGFILESFADPSRDPLWFELFRERPEVVEGHMTLPDKPGLGLELREDTLEKYGVKIG